MGEEGKQGVPTHILTREKRGPYSSYSQLTCRPQKSGQWRDLFTWEDAIKTSLSLRSSAGGAAL